MSSKRGGLARIPGFTAGAVRRNLLVGLLFVLLTLLAVTVFMSLL